MSVGRGGLICSLAALVAAFAPGAPAGEPAVLDRELPDALRRPTDVRWLDDDTLLISEPSRGVLEISVESLELGPSPFAENLGRFRRWVHLGVSPSHVAGAYVAFNSWWWPRSDREKIGSLPIEYVADLDLHGHRLLVAGLRRDDQGELGADGAMAWLLDLTRGEAEPTPLLPLSGNALQELQDCATALLPRVRFMAGGGLFVVPGVEPGLFLYDSSARLVHTWQTDALGLDQECSLSPEQKRRFNTDAGVRQGWLNQRRIVDDVLPLPAGPGLLVRSRADGVTRWELLRLEETDEGDGRVWRPVPLSITSPSPSVHASGDVREGRVALLLASAALRGQSEPPARLLTFRLEP